MERRPRAALVVLALVGALLQAACSDTAGGGGFPDARDSDGGMRDARGGENSDASGCGTGAGGDCEGSVLTFCEGGQAMTFDCADQSLPCRCRGGTCGCMADTPYPDGGMVGGPDGGSGSSCGSVTPAGACASDTVVVWCDQSTLQQYDCAYNGAWCECDGFGCGCCDFYGCF